MKMIVQLVRKCLGVKDIAALCVQSLPFFSMNKLTNRSLIVNRRLSLPASLLEPIPNLEYWNYLDRPDIFAALVFIFTTAWIYFDRKQQNQRFG